MVEKLKVVFLDFDGVLNSEKYVKTCGEYGVIIDPTRMVLLKKLIDATNAKIVLLTSWREHWDIDDNKCNNTGKQINDIFAQHGLNIFDKTSKLYLSRECEIKAWLDEHTGVKNFVVLDDMFLSAKFLEGHFIKTSNYFDGLDETDVKNAIKILNG